MTRVIAGPNQVVEAIRANTSIQVIYVLNGLSQKTAAKIFSLAQKNGIKTVSAGKEQLDTLSDGLHHQGVVALCGEFEYTSFESLLEDASKQPNSLLLVLDQVQDPGNLGAILRSAHSLGAFGVVITKNRSAQVTAAAVRASAGASEQIPVSRVINLASAIKTLQSSGFEVLGASLTGSLSLNDITWPVKCAIILGNEGKGIRKLTAESCDCLFHIPMATDFESLNVSASAAIVLYERLRCIQSQCDNRLKRLSKS